MNNWTENLLSNHVSLITKGTTPTSLGKSFKESGINFIKAESITESGEFILDSFAYIDEDTHELLKRSQLHDGDILFSIAGVLGRIAIVNSSILPANTNQAIALIRLSNNTEIESDFLKYFLNSEFIKEQIRRINVQSAQANFSLGDINRLVIKYPKDKPEQLQIATILSKADAVIEKTQAAIAKYKAIKQGMLQDLFTRGIDTTTGKLRPSYLDAPDLYKESKLGWIPKEWEEERLGNRAVIEYGKSQKAVVSINGNIPVYGTGGLMEYATDILFDGESILIGRKGTIDKPFYINGKFWTVDTAYYLSSFSGNVRWLHSQLEFYNLKRLNEATGVPSINREQLYNILLSFPEPKEQNEIVKRILSIDKKLQTEQDFLHKQQQIKAGLMHDLLSGEKQVTIKENQMA